MTQSPVNPGAAYAPPARRVPLRETGGAILSLIAEGVIVILGLAAVAAVTLIAVALMSGAPS